MEMTPSEHLQKADILRHFKYQSKLQTGFKQNALFHIRKLAMSKQKKIVADVKLWQGTSNEWMNKTKIIHSSFGYGQGQN